MNTPTPRTTLTVEVDVPEEILAEARARMIDADGEQSLDDYLADHVDIRFVVSQD